MDEFEKEKLKREIEKLDDERRRVFAFRIALAALPFLAEKAEEKGFVWYWQEEQCAKHLFAVLRALQISFEIDQKRLTNFAVAVAAAVSVSDSAVSASAVSYAAAYAAYASASATSAAYAASYAAYAAFTFRLSSKMDHFIWSELEYIKNSNNIFELQNTAINLPSEFIPLKKLFLAELRNFGQGFDYWADWLEDRYAGKTFDTELLEKSIFLPEEIETQTPAQINAYLKSLRDKPKQLNRVRVIFIGSGDAGKTSLIRVLRGESVIEGKEPMTAGIEINRFQIDEIKADLWDFGGQVMVHATHQFFLRERCLYVLVLHARPQLDPNEEALYWLEHIRAFGKDAPVLVVGNKIDSLAVNLNRNDLQDKYRNILGFYDISCTQKHTNEYKSYFLSFETAFKNAIKKLEIYQLYLPIAHFKVLEQLEKISPQQIFLTQTAFSALCEQNNVSKQEGLDQTWLLDLLDKLGVIIHFPNITYLEDYILNPRWLTYGVYTILYSKEIDEKKGQITENRLCAILQAEQVLDNLNNLLSYQNKVHWIIKAMEKFDICYKINTDTIIIPAKLPDSRPKIDFERYDSLVFDFDFEGLLPRQLIARFIVKHHQEIDKHVWQSGVQLYNSTFNTTALIESDSHNRRFSLWVKGEQASRYFAVLYHTVTTILQDMPKLPFQEFIRLLGTEEQINIRRRAAYKQLLAYEKNSKNEYIAEDGNIYNVSDLLKIMPIEERQKQQPVIIQNIINNQNTNQNTNSPQNNNQNTTTVEINMPKKETTQPAYQISTWEKAIVYLTGVAFVGLIAFLVVRNQPFADPNLVVMMRIILSTVAGIFAAVIPGFLQVDYSRKGFAIRAGGALAVWLLAFLLTPEVLK